VSRAGPPAALAAALAAAALWAGAGAALAGPPGLVETFDHRTIRVREFHHLAERYAFVLEGVVGQTPLAEIKSLTRVREGVEPATWDGRRFTVTGDLAVGRGQELEITRENPITGRPRRTSLDPLLLRRIVFDRPPGRERPPDP
jgi:hypothetical protein